MDPVYCYQPTCYYTTILLYYTTYCYQQSEWNKCQSGESYSQFCMCTVTIIVLLTKILLINQDIIIFVGNF